MTFNEILQIFINETIFLVYQPKTLGINRCWELCEQSSVKALWGLRFLYIFLGKWDWDSLWSVSCSSLCCDSGSSIYSLLYVYLHNTRPKGHAVTWKKTLVTSHVWGFSYLMLAIWKLLRVSGSCLQVYHLEEQNPLCLLVSFLHVVFISVRRGWAFLAASLCLDVQLALDGEVESRGGRLRSHKVLKEELASGLRGCSSQGG